MSETPTAPQPLRVLGHEFQVKPKLSVRAFADLISDQPGTTYRQLVDGIIDQIAASVLVRDEDRDRFRSLWDGDDFTDDVLADTRKQIIDLYTTGRPTNGDSPSSDGSGTPATGGPSTPTSSTPVAPASTPSPGT